MRRFMPGSPRVHAVAALGLIASIPACLLVTDLDELQGGAACDAALETDLDNCGACGNVCPVRANSVPVCAAGACSSACNGGFGDCDGVAMNGCEATFNADPRHCGACGHDCGGGECQLSTCQPVVVASEQAGPYGIALGGGSVLWLNYESGEVMRCATSGCPEGPALVAQGPPNAFFLKADATDVYWTRNGDDSVAKCPISGCVNATLLAPVTPDPTMIAIDETHVYFSSNGGELRRVGKDGTGLATLIDAQGNMGSLVVDGTDVYWSSQSLGVVRTCRIANCAATVATIASGYASTSTVAVSPTHVYWAGIGGDGESALWRVPRAGDSVEEVAKGTQEPWSLELVGGFIYWANRLPGGIVAKVPEAGGAVSILASVPGSPANCVADEQFVYYTDEITGTVWKVAR